MDIMNTWRRQEIENTLSIIVELDRTDLLGTGKARIAAANILADCARDDDYCIMARHLMEGQVLSIDFTGAYKIWWGIFGQQDRDCACLDRA